MTADAIDLSPYLERAKTADPMPAEGQVHEVVGLLVEVVGLSAATGDRLEIALPDRRLALEVLGFRQGRLLAAPLHREPETARLSRGLPPRRAQPA